MSALRWTLVIILYWWVSFLVDNGYSYGGGGFDGNGGGSVRRSDGFFGKVRDFFCDERYIELSFISLLVGFSLILYELASYVYLYFVKVVPFLAAMHSGDYMVRNIAGMFYTFCCVFVPFFVSCLIMRRTGVMKRELPFTAPEKGAGVFFLVLAGLGLCFAGNIFTSIFASSASSVGVEFSSYNQSLTADIYLPENVFEFIIMSFHTAVFPAVFEEFAFRGVVMQPLRKYGDWFAIIVSAVIFGFAHGNMTQMPFAILAGLALGYAAVVTKSLWTSIIIHFFNNFISLLYSFMGEILESHRVIVFNGLLIYGIILIGIVAFAGYVKLNPRFNILRPSEKPVKYSRATAVFILMPTMLFSFIKMLTNVASDIVF